MQANAMHPLSDASLILARIYSNLVKQVSNRVVIHGA